jgi:hypothetical protein
MEKNANPPLKYSCEICDFSTRNKQEYTRHISTRKHKKNAEGDKRDIENAPKNPPKYSCDICNFITGNKYDYTRHISTAKHKKNAEGDIKRIEKNPPPSTGFNCSCGKIYAVYGSLWRHKKTCDRKKNVDNREPPANILTNDIVLALINENKEIQKLFMEERKILIEKITELSKPQTNMVTNTNSNNSNNNNNNSFNLNFFLNEQCKDAINLVDFIDNLKVTVKDLERTGQIGFVEGISKIFIEGLKELDIYKRPIHCTDLKRETVYVRDQDKWEKENEEKPRLKTAVKKIAVKNIKQLRNWEVENPEFSNVDSKKNDEYMVISQNSLGGLSDKEDVKYENTIIKNVLKTAKLPTEESLVSTS